MHPTHVKQIRSYPAPTRGPFLLACGKCQRKLKDDGAPNGIASLKKALKQRAKASSQKVSVTVLKVPCLKMCPRDGITVCTAAQVAQHQCSIVRTGEDIDALIQLYPRKKKH